MNLQDTIRSYQKESCNLHTTILLQEEDIKQLRAEVIRLKDGRFTEEELHNLCHNMVTNDRCKFEQGCKDYQDKLFGPKP